MRVETIEDVFQLPPTTGTEKSALGQIVPACLASVSTVLAGDGGERRAPERGGPEVKEKVVPTVLTSWKLSIRGQRSELGRERIVDVGRSLCGEGSTTK